MCKARQFVIGVAYVPDRGRITQAAAILMALAYEEPPANSTRADAADMGAYGNVVCLAYQSFV
jgi:hypothetical protein